MLKSGLEVIKLEFILKLKIKRMIGCLRTRVRKQPIIALYFEFEIVLKFYMLEAWFFKLKGTALKANNSSELFPLRSVPL